MPIYEYECGSCGHHIEALQKVSDAPLTLCPECGKPALHKLISAAAFRLKGGGWYETDFKSGHKRNVLESGDKPASETKETKPADATVTKSDKAKGHQPAKPKPAERKKPVSSASS